ncbi:MAG TPA: transposase [Pyrinomonadaceae bacterium]|nr:transposase [Pyrinomonadaceae bacterium]
MYEIKGWHSRGYLPHFDTDRRTQFVTIRLFDSLPEDTLFKLKDELRLKAVHGVEDLELQRRIEKYLDMGSGSCWLRRPEIATVVQNALLEADSALCQLRGWVIMPNHSHILLRPNEGVSLSKIMQKVKGASALEANRLLGRTGSFWMRDYFDRYIRDPEHFSKALRYIEQTR